MAGDYDLGGAWLSLPEGIQPYKRHGPDFDTFSFKDKTKRQVLFIYVGYFPNSEVPKNQIIAQGKRNGLKTRKVTWQDSQKRRRCEVLVQLDKRLVAHCIYAAVSDTEVRSSEALLATLRRRRQDKMRA